MSDLQKFTYLIKDAKISSGALMEEFIGALGHVDLSGMVRVTIEVETDISKMKKLYFAMVSELAAYAGYISHKDKHQFKEDVRTSLSIPSIAEIKTTPEMSAAIEGLHQLAGVHYAYTFKRDGRTDTSIITFPDQ